MTALAEGGIASLAGRRFDAGTARWSADDALLYALAVGADEPAFTTESVEQQVLPTFPVVLTGDAPHVHIWHTADGAVFRTVVGHRLVLDRGVFRTSGQHR